MGGSFGQGVRRWIHIQDENNVGVACPTLLPRVHSLQVPPHVISSSPSDFSHLCALLFTAENKTPSRAPSTEQGADNDDGLGKHAELNNARN